MTVTSLGRASGPCPLSVRSVSAGVSRFLCRPGRAFVRSLPLSDTHCPPFLALTVTLCVPVRFACAFVRSCPPLLLSGLCPRLGHGSTALARVVCSCLPQSCTAHWDPDYFACLCPGLGRDLVQFCLVFCIKLVRVFFVSAFVQVFLWGSGLAVFCPVLPAFVCVSLYSAWPCLNRIYQSMLAGYIFLGIHFDSVNRAMANAISCLTLFGVYAGVIRMFGGGWQMFFCKFFLRLAGFTAFPKWNFAKTYARTSCFQR